MLRRTLSIGVAFPGPALTAFALPACRPFIWVSLFLIPATCADAQEAPAKTASGKGPGIEAVEPYLNLGVGALIHVDLRGAGHSELVRSLAGAFTGPTSELESRRRQATQWDDDLRAAGATDLYATFWISEFATLPPRIIVLGGASKSEQAKILAFFDPESLHGGVPVAELLKFLGADSIRPIPAGIVIGGSRANLKAQVDQDELNRWMRPSPRPDLVAALDSVKSSPVKLVVGASPELRKPILELLDQFAIKVPDAGWPSVLDELKWVAIGLQHDRAAEGPAISVVWQAKSAEGAKMLRQHLQRIGRAWVSYGGAFESPKDAAEWLDLLLPDVESDRLVLRIAHDSKPNAALFNVLRSAQGAAAEQARVATTRLRLKSIGVSMHNYHDVFRRFPARAIEDKAGRPLLSWRVKLLPQLETSNLYDRFHLDEPWDSPHNRELIKLMPDAYRCGKSELDAAGKTVFVLPVSRETMFSAKSGPRIGDVPDGLTNTIMSVEADDEHAVVWTRPEDFSYQSERPLAGLAVHWLEGTRMVQVLMGAGAIKQVAVDESVGFVRALFTSSGKEPQDTLK